MPWLSAMRQDPPPPLEAILVIFGRWGEVKKGEVKKLKS